MPIDSLIVLAALRGLKRLTTEELALHIQREPAQAKRTLEALVEAGLAQAHGTTRGHTYTLAANVYPPKEARLLTRGRWVLAISNMSSWYSPMRASMRNSTRRSD